MNAVIVAEDARVAEELAEKLNERFENRVGFSVIPLQGDLIGKIKKMNPELLLTVDLAGFDRVTLTDNIAYNLLDCKQVHVICGKTLQNEKALEKALSIAMFFACSSAEQCGQLKERYPHIPWMKCMEDWSLAEDLCTDKNVEEIVKMLECVIKECRLN